MGSACSSGQTGRDRDSISTKSEESRSYQVNQDIQKQSIGEVSKRGSTDRRSFTEGILLSVQSNLQPSQPLIPEASTSGSPAKSKLERLSSNKQQTILCQGIHSWKERKITIYVCASDPFDCKVEKSLLANEVYPELRQNLEKIDFELHIVDLHWSQFSQHLQLCIHELSRQGERSNIIPLVFLNDSLGPPLLPRTLESSDFETAFPSEADRQLLEKWYTKDEEAQPPCYRLIRPSSLIPNLKSSEPGLREKALAEWKNEVDKVIDIMLSKFSDELRDTYLTTVLEQEVQSTVVMSRELASRCIWFSRCAPVPQSTSQTKNSQGELELKRRLELLKNTLKSELEEVNILKLTPSVGSDHSEQPEYLSNVVAQLKKRLSVIIEAIAEEYETKTNYNGLNLEREVQWHKYFAEKNSRCGANRQGILEFVEKSDLNGVIIITGAEGSGKTALLARLSSQVKTEVIFREVGLTRYSSTLVNLLYSICTELEGTETHSSERTHNIETYSKILPEILEKFGTVKPLTLIIDGIDQFREFGLNAVNWLPKTLPNSVKMVVSMSDSSDLLLSKLKSHLANTNAQFIPIPDLSKTEASNILISSILEYNHSFSTCIQENVFQCLDSCTLPLYIKLLAWQSSWCAKNSQETEPQANLRDQLLKMLCDLEYMLGKEQVEKVLSLLSSTKWGITDSEILDILCSDSIFHSSETHLSWMGACIFWSNLTRHLGPFLDLGEKGGNSIFPLSLARVVRDRYRSKIPAMSSLLHRYFTGRLWEDGKKIKSRMTLQPTKYGETYNRRKLEELPFLTLKTQGTSGKYTLDADWILDKLCGSSVHQLLEDLYMENENEDVQWLQRFLETNAVALDYDGRQLYAQIARHRYPLNTTLGQTLLGPPRIVSLIESEKEEPQEEALEIDQIARLPQNQAFIVTVSTNSEEISVWNIQRCKRVRRLRNVPQPSSLLMVDDFKAVVLCKRELRVFDLNKGEELTLLKGVMNQRMPYFGLHDSEHLVALSRNRMYVNLMNINSGDLVTTFKAGEDRFLNSLLVSGDGRFLVCGDETQKPMPLLVWNLSSRKLLYDLRIPQHDFVTKLAAITYNGGYVAVVAKEVDESSPNYLVVYDLQSGTLFKKWKRGVDCVAVEISSAESCVLSAHTDVCVMAWDLVTGNCRWKLKGHRSPTDILKLSPSGSVLLTRSSGPDTSIRLWNLSSGSLLAVFSPSSKIRDANLTDNHLILCSEESENNFSTFQLQGPGYTYRAKEEIYGDEMDDSDR